MRPLLTAAALCLSSLSLAAQPAGWNDPFPPHKVMDNLYYVGTSELASFLFTTPEGHILYSANYESSVPVIRDAVEELGFNFSDVKILLSGHAHPDHAEGDALVKELTGAQVVVGRLEEEVVRGIMPGGKPHPIDRLIDDGDTVELGGTVLTAHVMPGHTRGCLAWSTELEEDGETYYAFIECSLNGQFLQVLDNYPGIIDDFRATYQKAREFPVEVFLSSHASFYGLPEKFEKFQARGEGDPNPFVDPDGYQAHVDQFEASFEAALAQQQSGKGKGKGKAK